MIYINTNLHCGVRSGHSSDEGHVRFTEHQSKNIKRFVRSAWTTTCPHICRTRNCLHHSQSLEWSDTTHQSLLFNSERSWRPGSSNSPPASPGEARLTSAQRLGTLPGDGASTNIHNLTGSILEKVLKYKAVPRPATLHTLNTMKYISFYISILRHMWCNVF